MPPSEESQKIMGQFSRYIRDKNKALIEHYTIEDIERAICEYGNDKDMPYYKAAEMRINELREKGSIDLATNANRISKSAKRAAWWAVWIAISSLLIVIFRR